MHDPTPSPEFLAAASAFRDLLVQDRAHTPAGLRAWQAVMETAPPEFLETMHAEAVRLGLIPEKPDGYTDEGEPVYRLEEIARRAGLSVEEAEASIIEFSAVTGAQEVDLSQVHRTQ